MRKTTKKSHLLTTMMLSLSVCASTDAGAQAPPDPCKNLNKPNKPLQLQLDEFELVLKRKKRMCLDFRTISTGTFRIRVDVGDSGYTCGGRRDHRCRQVNGDRRTRYQRDRTRRDPDEIIVDVKDASVPVPNSADYDYWIKVPGVGTLDPKVRIIRQNSVPLQAQDLAMALQDIGLDREEAQRLLGQCPDLNNCKEQPTEQY